MHGTNMLVFKKTKQKKKPVCLAVIKSGLYATVS